MQDYKLIKQKAREPRKYFLISHAWTRLGYLRTILMVLALLFFSFPKPVSAEISCNLDKVYKNAAFYDPCDVGENNSCSASADLSGSSNEEKIWNFFGGKGLKPIAIAGIMGNFQQESFTYDPAQKQDNTMIAIPDAGDNRTGYGIAQWTSQGRQALLFTEIRNAGLQQYYGAGWGSAEKDKDIPAPDINKLLSIELNFAWTGDTTKIQDIAKQLNNTNSVEGENGSTLLFHKLYERSGDNASQIQDRVNSATKILQKYGGTGVLSSGSCSTGQLGGVSNLDDAVAWATKFYQETQAKYHPGGYSLNQRKSSGGDTISLYHITDNNSACWGGADCSQCTALSGWFVSTKTGYTYGGGDGGQVVANLRAKGAPTGNQPKPFSVFSYDTGSYGHTGVVLGVLSDGSVITMENNWPSDDTGGTLVVRKYNIKQRYPSATFAYVGDKLTVPGVPAN
jgi:surface antigen